MGIDQPPGPTPAPTTAPPTPAPVDPTEDDGPFEGVAAQIPGTVEAEEYDYGGPGVAYSDTDPGNNGGVRDRFLFLSDGLIDERGGDFSRTLAGR